MDTQMPILIILLICATIFFHPTLSSSQLCHSEDREALVLIKKALNNPDSEIFTSWDPQTDCCNWAFVECDPITNRVSALIITNNAHLLGPIPPAIAKLNNLKTLVINNTAIFGPIPDCLGELKSLEAIDLGRNRLSGPIPRSIGKLPQLLWLNLGWNKLAGPIPETFGELKKLQYVDLSHNKLSGQVPTSLGSINGINYLDLSWNRLEGDASALFVGSKKANLVLLDLSWNLFEFDFSKVELPKSLLYLDINHNRIFGRIPEGINDVLLGFIDVSFNRLCGQIPQGGSLQGFDSKAFLHNTCLRGQPLVPSHNSGVLVQSE